MMTNPSIFRRAYDGVALFAILNVLAVGVLGAFLVSSGAIDAEKLREIVAVMRGDATEKLEDTLPSDSETADAPVNPDAVGGATVVPLMNAEIVRLEADRVKAELDQRLALNNSILLRVTAERDRFKREQADALQQETASAQRRLEKGFRKQVDIYESLASKVAVEHLLSLPNVDEAARILLEMDTRKAKSIVEAAKSPEQLDKMKAVLQRMEEVAPERSEDLGNDGN